MQVSVEKTSELNRKMTVRVPEELIQEKMEARLKSLAREIKLDGFRPGKVPQHVVKKLYGSRVRSEITGDLIQSSYVEALQEQEQRPAGPPHIVPSNMEEAGSGFEYIAEFEVYPEVSLEHLGEVEVTRKTAEITDDDLEAMIQKLRDQQKTWNEVERASKDGDQVTIKFTGTCEGENFTDGTVEDFPVEIGSGQMVPGFEDNLVGLEAGSSKTFEVTFPEEYGRKELAGKDAQFEIEVIKIEESEQPGIDEDFIKAYGVEDGEMDSFRTDVRGNMQRELDQAIRGQTKNAVMDGLYEKIALTLPKTSVDQEVESLMKPYLESAKKQNKNPEELDMPRDEFQKQAERRVALGLILAEIINKNEIKVDGNRVRSMVEEMAKSYERPEDVVSWYYADQSRLAEVEQMVLEDQTVEWVLDQIIINDENVNFDDIMNQSH